MFLHNAQTKTPKQVSIKRTQLRELFKPCTTHKEYTNQIGRIFNHLTIKGLSITDRYKEVFYKRHFIQLLKRKLKVIFHLIPWLSTSYSDNNTKINLWKGKKYAPKDNKISLQRIEKILSKRTFIIVNITTTYTKVKVALSYRMQYERRSLIFLGKHQAKMEGEKPPFLDAKAWQKYNKWGLNENRKMSTKTYLLGSQKVIN